MKECLIASAAAAAFLFASQASADVLGELVSGPTSGSSSWQNVPTGTGGSGYTIGSGLTFGSGSTFTVRSVNQGSQAAAITNGDVVTWGLTYTQPYHLDDFSIRFDKDTNGADDVAIQISINGGAFTTVLTDTAVNVNGEEHLNVSLAAFDNVSSFTMRAVLWNAGANSGSFDFENSANIGSPTAASFRLNGTPVPEPATAGLLGLAGLAMLRRRRA